MNWIQRLRERVREKHTGETIRVCSICHKAQKVSSKKWMNTQVGWRCWPCSVGDK